MSIIQKIKSCFIALLLLAAAFILIMVPAESFMLIPIILGVTLLIYGGTFLVYYLRMARHMVGGKAFLFRAVILMDVALFTISISAMSNRLVVLLYLLGVFAFTGGVDILRAFEAKQNGDQGWKWKFYRGMVEILFTIALFIIGFILNLTDIFVYGYCISLTYSAVMRIIAAFKKTNMVCIQ